MLKLQAIMYLHDTEGQYLQNLKTLHEVRTERKKCFLIVIDNPSLF